MLVMHGVAKLVDTFGLSLFHSTHMWSFLTVSSDLFLLSNFWFKSGMGRSALGIFLCFDLHFMVQLFSNHRAALASGDFAIQWCNHSQSTRLLLRANVLAGKALLQTAFDCQMAPSRLVAVCTPSMGPCLKIHK